MKTAALEYEMRTAVAAMEPQDSDTLARFGVPPEIVARKMVGVARVWGDLDDAFYEPTPAGRWAFLTPVRTQHAHTPESDADGGLRGSLVDKSSHGTRNVLGDGDFALGRLAGSAASSLSIASPSPSESGVRRSRGCATAVSASFP
jgi:hypothetical protein